MVLGYEFVICPGAIFNSDVITIAIEPVVQRKKRINDAQHSHEWFSDGVEAIGLMVRLINTLANHAQQR